MQPRLMQAGQEGDKKLGEGFYHNPVAQSEHISKKVYLFPPSFNALRRELQDNWKDFFETVSPLTGTSPAWCMVFDAPQFIDHEWIHRTVTANGQ